MPTEYGPVHVVVYQSGDEKQEHIAMLVGDVAAGDAPVLARVHSECWTGEVMRSHKCDCRDQLDRAMQAIAQAGRGVVVYLRQEGRGIGLANKIRAYELQARGHDTVDANRMLGLPDDARNYGVAASMLDYLGVESVRLMTNNPEKVRAMRALGVRVDDRIPVVVEPNTFSAGYLETKRLRMSHDLPAYLDASVNVKRAANGK